MMNVKTKAATIVAITMLVLPSATTMSLANETTQAETKILALDKTTTSSIEPATARNNCDPNSLNADLVCKITGGDPNVKFPSAPSTAFGF